MNIAQSLQALMKENGFSNSKLARKLGVHTSTVSNWLSGKDVKAENLSAICELFGCSMDYLAGIEEKEKAPSDTGEGEITESQLKAAFFRGADPTLTDEEIDAMWEDAKDLRDILIMKKRRERKSGK